MHAAKIIRAFAPWAVFALVCACSTAEINRPASPPPAIGDTQAALTPAAPSTGASSALTPTPKPAPARAAADERRGAESVAADTSARDADGRFVVINGKRLSSAEIRQLDQVACVRVPDGSYWLDTRTGIWGYAENPQPRGYLGGACSSRNSYYGRPMLSERGLLYYGSESVPYSYSVEPDGVTSIPPSQPLALEPEAQNRLRFFRSLPNLRPEPVTKQKSALPTESSVARAEASPPPRPAQTSPVARAEVSPPPPAEASPELERDTDRTQRRDAYLNGLRQASYAFNPPSPITVAEPRTVHFWVDPVVAIEALAADLKRVVPRDAGRIEAGATTWSPRMRATLTGDSFEITPNEPGGREFGGVKDLSVKRRTEWSWDIVPKRPGDALNLHLRLSAVLPADLGEPHEITVLHREVTVKATLWWLIDSYWEKYWKWILGGIASAVASITAYWWKNRRPKTGDAPVHVAG